MARQRALKQDEIGIDSQGELVEGLFVDTKIFWILPLLAFIFVIYAESRPKDSLAKSRAAGVNARYLLVGVILACAVISLVLS